MLRLIVGTTVVLALGGVAGGGRAAVSGSTSPDQAPIASTEARPSTIKVLAAQQIVGRDLRDPSGADAGTINSLVIDTRTGVVDFALVGSSGSFNAGGSDIAVPWLALQPPGSGNGPIITRIGARKIAQSPRIDPSLVYELDQPIQRERIYNYYGYNYPGYYRYGYGLGPMRGYGVYPRYGARLAGPVPQTAVTNPPNKASAPQTSKTDAAGASALIVTRGDVISTLDEQGTTSTGALQNASVHGLDGDSLGNVDEVMIDVDRGEVAYVLLSRGGFLGLNQRWYALPIEALTPAPYKGGYRLTVDAQMLLLEPPLTVNRQDLPTSVNAAQLAALYGQFGIVPYWEQDNQRNAPGAKLTDNQGQQSNAQSGSSR